MLLAASGLGTDIHAAEVPASARAAADHRSGADHADGSRLPRDGELKETSLYRAPIHHPLHGGAHGGSATQWLKELASDMPSTEADAATRAATLREIAELHKLRKAGPHILGAIRSCGTRSIRHWLLDFASPELMRGKRATHLWSTAWCLDHELSKCKDKAETDRWLHESLGAELQLRTLAAAEMESRMRISPQVARTISAGPLQWGVVPFWMQREARRASKRESLWRRRSSEISQVLLGPFLPKTVAPEDDDAETDRGEDVSGGGAVRAPRRCLAPGRRDGKT